MEAVKEINKFIQADGVIENQLATFVVGSILGQGGTSIVYEASIKGSPVAFAIKVFSEDVSKKQSTAYKRFRQTYINLSSIQHLGFLLPQIHWGVITVPDVGQFPYSVMLKADSTLFGEFKSTETSFSDFKGVFSELGHSIEKLHNQKIIHRDLKPQNIFRVGGKIVIGDCDIASYDSELHLKLVKTRKSDRPANFLFSAPEQSDSKIGELSNASDWFAFGQILYWLSEKSTYRGTGGIALRFKESESKLYERIITRLLAKNPADRFQSFGEIEDFISKDATDRREKSRIDRIHKSLSLFDDLISKYTCEHGTYSCISETEKPEEIVDACEFLKNNAQSLDLWMFQGDRDWQVESIEFGSAGTVLFKHHEIAISKLSFFLLTRSFGGSLIIVHSKKLVPLTKVEMSQMEEEVCFYKDRIISRAEYDSGWAVIDGVRTRLKGEADLKVRTINETIYFLCPQYGLKYENFKYLEKIFLDYEKRPLTKSELFEQMQHMRRAEVAWTYD